MNVASVLQILAGVAWLAFVLVVFMAGINASRGRPIKGVVSILIGVAVFAVVLTTLSSGLVFVQPDQRAVVISAIAPKGYREQALEPGLHWIIPYFENVVYYSIAQQTYTMSIVPTEGQTEGDDSVSARTSDGQEVKVDASVIYSIDPVKVTQIHIEWQNRYSTDLVRPISRGIIRDTLSQFRVDQVYSSKRAEVTSQMNEAMRTKLSENGLILSDFIVRNIEFSPEYAASVEQKQIAEQQAQQAKFTVEQRKQEAEMARQVAQGKSDAAVISSEGESKARRIRANAEADALTAIGKALSTQPDLLTYQYISSLAPGIQVMLVPNDNPYILPIPSLNPQRSTINKETNTKEEPILPVLPVLPTPILPTPVPSPTPQ